MAKNHLFFVGILVFNLLIQQKIYSQIFGNQKFKEAKQFVGFQANPYLPYLSDLDFQGSKNKVFCLRYGIEVVNGLYVGPQYFFFGGTNNSVNLKTSSNNLGIFSRYNPLHKKKLGVLIEAAFHYKLEAYKYLSHSESGKRDGIGWYAATGLGINLYKKKVTLDLMVKYSPDVWFESQHFVPTYKLNYHFN